MSFIKTIVVGHLGGNPEFKTLQSGVALCSFSMAADGRKKDSPPTWLRISAFGDHAERLRKVADMGYVQKGSLLYVEGQFEVREYTANDGTIRTSNDVVMTDWQFVGGGEKQDGNQQASNQQNAGASSQDDSEAPF